MLKSERLHWVDALRGSIVALMLVYHFAFDLNYLSLVSADPNSGFWFVLATLIRIGFFSLVGLSLFLSYQNSDYPAFLKKQFRRVAILLGCALMISGVTLILFPQEPIFFGALHFIVVSVTIGVFIIRYPLLLLASVPVVFALTPSFDRLIPESWASLDFIPFFPWVTIVFVGILMGYALSAIGLLRNSKKLPRLRSIEWAGRHALIIYLIHQPLFFGLLWLWLRLG